MKPLIRGEVQEKAAIVAFREAKLSLHERNIKDSTLENMHLFRDPHGQVKGHKRLHDGLSYYIIFLI